MKRLWMVMMIAATLIPSMVLAANEIYLADGVTIYPTNMTLGMNLSETKTVNITITSNESIYDEITITSLYYLTEYSPVGKHLDPGVTETFVLTFQSPDEYDRSPDELNITNVLLYDEVTITGYNGTDTEFLGYINVTINLTLPELELPERDYVFKKCFIEGDAEFCTEMNMSEYIEQFKNITIINVTEENVTYNVMMPYNTTKQFMEEYAKTLRDAADQMSLERQWLVEVLNETINMQRTKNDQFQNAFMLENYLKNPQVPTWIELAPENHLKNITGFGDQELMDAMNVLFQQNKLTQKTEKEVLTIPVPNGIMTQEIQKIYIASSERLEETTRQESAENTVFLSVAIVIVTIILGLFYIFVWRKRVSWTS